MRTMTRQLRNGLGGKSRWGDTDTNDHNRKHNKGKYNDKGQ